MVTTDDNKLRSLAAALGVGSLALFGVTACDTNGDTGEEDPAVEEEEGMEEDPAEEDPMEEEEEG
ncbi:hypothetical protein [Nesterenkonia sp. HG001]|uniref:hypothetical protein n=1 Tax=Nesterenkonia sp. HG001 TaxID=2983207 RepID=UPI002AC6573F|nr:hypothetical protein [Nesterenkonia sp. HG001]MDZ5076831.1 hypothetical protein [Nesterenkonia sp. HG001]